MMNGSNRIKASFDAVKAPKELKQKTLQAMEQEKAADRKGPAIRRLAAAPALLCLLIAAAAVFVTLVPKSLVEIAAPSGSQAPQHTTSSAASLPQENSENSTSVSAAYKPYPYEDRLKFIPKDVEVSRLQNGFLVYNQLKGTSDGVLDYHSSLYDASGLRRSFFPEFDEEGRVSFSRVSDPSDSDEQRYREYLQYGGERTKDLLLALSRAHQHEAASQQCTLLQSGQNPKTLGIAVQEPIFDNCSLSVLLSNDFSELITGEEQAYLKSLRRTLSDGVASMLGEDHVTVQFMYQQRKNKDTGELEERYIYYAYFQKNGKEVLVQFVSNYAKPNGSETTYGLTGVTQKEARNAFEQLLVLVHETL